MSIVKLTVYVEMEDPMGTPINACVKIEEGMIPCSIYAPIMEAFGGAYLKPPEYFIGKTTPVSIQDGVTVVGEPERLERGTSQ